MHRLLIILLSLALAACSTINKVSLYAGPQLPPEQEVRVLLPEHFDAIEFNGYPIPQSSLRFRTGKMPLTLPPGEHTLTLRYHDIWNIDDENHETLTSGHIIFKFTAAPGEVFHLEHSKISGYESAKQFSMSPRVTLKSGQSAFKGSHLKKENPLVFNQSESKPVKYPHLEQLKFWWNQATQYERDEFNLWLNTQK